MCAHSRRLPVRTRAFGPTMTGPNLPSPRLPISVAEERSPRRTRTGLCGGKTSSRGRRMTHASEVAPAGSPRATRVVSRMNRRDCLRRTVRFSRVMHDSPGAAAGTFEMGARSVSPARTALGSDSVGTSTATPGLCELGQFHAGRHLPGR